MQLFGENVFELMQRNNDYAFNDYLNIGIEGCYNIFKKIISNKLKMDIKICNDYFDNIDILFNKTHKISNYYCYINDIIYIINFFNISFVVYDIYTNNFYIWVIYTHIKDSNIYYNIYKLNYYTDKCIFKVFFNNKSKIYNSIKLIKSYYYDIDFMNKIEPVKVLKYIDARFRRCACCCDSYIDMVYKIYNYMSENFEEKIFKNVIIYKNNNYFRSDIYSLYRLYKKKYIYNNYVFYTFILLN